MHTNVSKKSVLTMNVCHSPRHHFAAPSSIYDPTTTAAAAQYLMNPAANPAAAALVSWPHSLAFGLGNPLIPPHDPFSAAVHQYRLVLQVSKIMFWFDREKKMCDTFPVEKNALSRVWGDESFALQKFAKLLMSSRSTMQDNYANSNFFVAVFVESVTFDVFLTLCFPEKYSLKLLNFG